MDLASDMMARPECRAEHEALLSELMIAVIERFTPWKSFPRSIRELNASACDRRIRRAADYIRVNAGGEADIDTLAKEAGLSRAHFFRLFQSSIGLPPKVYLNVVRMEQAMEAVLHHDFPVGEIGARLGFSDPAHFTRFFRNNAGVSPSEFRQVSRLAG
jgi:AraC-like DNA-binding protein